MAIEPGLNVVTDMGRPIDSRVFIMGNTDLLALSIPDKVGPTFQRMHLADDRDRRRLSDAQRYALLFTQRPETIPIPRDSCDNCPCRSD